MFFIVLEANSGASIEVLAWFLRLERALLEIRKLSGPNPVSTTLGPVPESIHLYTKQQERWILSDQRLHLRVPERIYEPQEPTKHLVWFFTHPPKICRVQYG